MTIEITKVSGNYLHCQYPGQTSAQPVHVELDCREEGALSASYNPEIGSGVPETVHARFVLRWTIPALKADAANELLAKIAPLAERIVSGFDEVWNGSNFVGDFDDDADDACEDIEALCDKARGAGEDEALSVWQAADWYAGVGSARAQAAELGITENTTDDQLVKIAAREAQNAKSDGVDVLNNLDKYLESIRSFCIAEAKEVDDAAE
jgi:hypothetical protein